MRYFWPRSLKGRYSLLLIVLVLVTQLLSTLVFLNFVQRPRVNDAVQLIAAQAVMLNKFLSPLPPAQRDYYAGQLNALSSPPPALVEPKVNPFMGFIQGYDLKRFLEKLQAKLPAGMYVRWQAEPVRRFWFQVHIAGQPYWITLPDIKSERTTGWASALLLSLSLSVVALLVAWLTHRHFTHSLTRLVKAARDVGRGGRPAPLPLNGPREIEQVSLTFNHMLKGLSDQEEKRAVLLAGISHDIRTPLTKLRLAIAMSQNQSTFTDDFQRYFDDIDGILQQFIEFARGESHEPMEKADINQLITALAQDFTGLGYPFALNLMPIPAFHWRHTSILRLCMNLMQNAAKYGKKDREIASWHHQGYAWIAIYDRGPGIAADEIQDICQPFSRGSQTEQLSGAGLGLAIADRIVAQHQGQLSINNREQGGLEVLFTLKMD